MKYGPMIPVSIELVHDKIAHEMFVLGHDLNPPITYPDDLDAALDEAERIHKAVIDRLTEAIRDAIAMEVSDE